MILIHENNLKYKIIKIFQRFLFIIFRSFIFKYFSFCHKEKKKERLGDAIFRKNTIFLLVWDSIFRKMLFTTSDQKISIFDGKCEKILGIICVNGWEFYSNILTTSWKKAWWSIRMFFKIIKMIKKSKIQYYFKYISINNLITKIKYIHNTNSIIF